MKLLELKLLELSDREEYRLAKLHPSVGVPMESGHQYNP